ncbi:TAXI family TRAP transporter solute-binding subunit [Peptoniphilus catoniae]|uniref:TAXI family TRAP transporter solute-binding subunit n=1 Tax=Peptoniphilus catoniae TaxID=1660341 RepID=UPI0010FED12E|nr:TAXI family TRAP transporter solute-binding subunit [Peptoniphilus catoniae]
MKKSKISAILLVILSLSMILTSCGNKNSSSGETTEENKTSSSGEVKNITWGSASLGGSAQMMVTAIGTVVQEKDPSLHITVQSTGGSAENPRLLRNGSIDIGHTTEAYNAYVGEGIFEGEGPIEDLMVVLKTYGVEALVLTLEDSPIKSMNDLVGKKVCIGPPGSGIAQMAQAILEAYDITDKVTILNLGHNESVDSLKEGSIDVLFSFTTGGMPASYLQQLDSTSKIKAIPLDMNVLQKAFDKYKDYAGETIPEGAISCLDKPYETLASYGIQVTRKSLTEDEVYSIVKNTYENIPELENYIKLASALNIKTVLKGVPKELKIHPGAAKYFKEQGVWDDSYTIGELD